MAIQIWLVAFMVMLLIGLWMILLGGAGLIIRAIKKQKKAAIKPVYHVLSWISLILGIILTVIPTIFVIGLMNS